jgi:hypothetical protein
MIKGVYAIAIAVAELTACSGSKGSAVSTGANATSRAPIRAPAVTSADFTQIEAWGPKGQPSVAHCPPQHAVIAGGSSSSDGSFVGTGHADTNRSAWIVIPVAEARAEAFATCVLRTAARASFQWRSAGPTDGLAAAQCRTGYMLVAGYATGSVSASWFDPSTRTYWVRGGGTAYVSCARIDAGIQIKHAWNQSQKPKAVFAGCGTGYTVIGGSMGNSAWPGPPIQEHPGAGAAPRIHADRGWWTFSNALNELTWAACVRA